MSVAKLTANKAKFAIYAFTSNSNGATNVQPLGLVVNEPLADDPANNTLDPNFVNNLNNLGTVTYSPLAEGLTSIGGYYNSLLIPRRRQLLREELLLSWCRPDYPPRTRARPAGSMPSSFSDYDGDGGTEGQHPRKGLGTYIIPKNLNGSTYLDDVAYYLFRTTWSATNPDSRTCGPTPSGSWAIWPQPVPDQHLQQRERQEESLRPTDKYYGKYHFVAEEPERTGAGDTGRGQRHHLPDQLVHRAGRAGDAHDQRQPHLHGLFQAVGGQLLGG